ncbi:GNAT family N-acetyltransferase [Candidatus Bealeia paramacronuclearis]|uniref:GNAT family N-acetyltransferase n=1 Tax=Candidatus Bealeia paramacronuclearis TaxID=1921001 RepID=A0ABZ2C1P7_9PROT|nr:GNAT family N-acetyltransferase [Candidatus Bealeia paramacronuclearis]
MSFEKSESIRHSSRQIVRELGFLNKFPKYEDISASQIHMMIELSTYGRLSGSELAEKLQLDKSTISRSTQLLMEKGWIQSKSHGKDARAKDYSLTPSGFERIKLSHIRAHRIVNRALSQLSSDEQNMVMKGLQLYGNALEKSRKIDFLVAVLLPSYPLNDIVHFINSIQIHEFSIPVSEAMNESLYQAPTYYRDSQGAINFWVAEDAQGIVGTVGLKQLSNKSGEIKKLFVRQDCRHKGVSVELISHLMQRAHALGLETLYLGTVSHLVAAQRFYEKMGFYRISKNDLPETFEFCEVDTEFFKYEL